VKYCLIIDDSDLLRQTARRLLEEAGFDTAEAASGQAGIESCQTRPPDAILLDCQLADMSGIDFLVSLPGATSDRKPFILYCATDNDTEELERALAAGADAYLLKPFAAIELAAKMADAG
jgi:two-component system chemotaxis response regulator CheY